MPKIRLTFQKCIQDSQEFGSTNEHMVSRLFFKFEVNGLEYTGCHCNVKQTVGAQYESDSPLEISHPAGTSYNGPFNYAAFRMEAERYYREGFGSLGHGIHIGPGAKNVRMWDNVYVREKIVEFEASGTVMAW